MSAPQNIVAVIFDFDDTLADDSTTQLLEAHKIDAEQFWQVNGERVRQGWNPTLSYLTLFLEKVGDGKPLGRLGNEDLREFGSTLKFYPGIPRLFTDLQSLVKDFPLSNPHIEFYVISGGLEQVIRGSKIAKHLSGIWGCQFAEDASGTIRHIMNAISFTEKTKCLFEINKGIVDESRTRQYAVNTYVSTEDRRIPFRNMIYLGDGLTDVPCFSLVAGGNGTAFGVFDPKKTGSSKKAFENLVVPKRVQTMNSPKYRESDELGALLRAAVGQVCQEMEVKTRSFRTS